MIVFKGANSLFNIIINNITMKSVFLTLGFLLATASAGPRSLKSLLQTNTVTENKAVAEAVAETATEAEA